VYVDAAVVRELSRKCFVEPRFAEEVTSPVPYLALDAASCAVNVVLHDWFAPAGETVLRAFGTNRRCLGDQVAQALVVLVAGRAALEVSAHAGEASVGILARDLEVYVLVEQLEALLAADLGLGRPQQTCEELAA
jgi:hypothetical protein